ncbi:ChrR family anti-sigma-E factor [Chelativorans intermedius]|uniref:ChrR family anti-sigma-E factor n=1 Tax=Chelativorans intermedius TaxID=515947 RepID=A0ABV6D2T1_9HYPH|nr:ChrR family anti-sigma-E factor [Chelativorans intermedius]MCT8997242.1 ChrR family anti-sigma-E factor [Chelativorans intermedius]
MSILHHPSDETLLRFAAGSLPAGPALVVASHLEGCAVCRNRVAQFEAVGGAMLADLPPTPLKADAFARVLARAQAGQAEKDTPEGIFLEREAPKKLDGIVLPRALHGCAIGAWRWVGPGIRVSRVVVPHARQANVILLKVRAGRHMPAHGHTDFEITQVLRGSFRDGGKRYGVGDVAEGDSECDHAPVVGEESECISLAAIEGHIRFRGPIGRLLQPLVGL